MSEELSVIANTVFVGVFSSFPLQLK